MSHGTLCESRDGWPRSLVLRKPLVHVKKIRRIFLRNPATLVMGDSGEALRTCTCESLMKLIKEDVEYSDVSLTKAIPILLDSKTKNLVAFPVKAFADDKYYYLVLDGKTVYQSYLNNKTPSRIVAMSFCEPRS